jgi:hypothetical protein
VGFRLAPALEVQLGDHIALQVRALLVQVTAAPESMRSVTIGYGFLPSVIFSTGWRSDVIVDVGVTNTTTGSLAVSASLTGLWRF